jgi:hypothetical protein
MALAKCVLTDIAGKKRGPTKSAAAGMLRVAVRCAEDARLSGKANVRSPSLSCYLAIYANSWRRQLSVGLLAARTLCFGSDLFSEV